MLERRQISQLDSNNSLVRLNDVEASKQTDGSVCQSETPNKIFPNCKHAVHLIICESHPGLDGYRAREGAGGKISRTTASEFRDFSWIFQDLCL